MGIQSRSGLFLALAPTHVTEACLDFGVFLGAAAFCLLFGAVLVLASFLISLEELWVADLSTTFSLIFEALAGVVTWTQDLVLADDFLPFLGAVVGASTAFWSPTKYNEL